MIIKQMALDAGYSEAQADAIAAIVALREETGAGAELIVEYPLWRPGAYNAAQGGEFEITEADVAEMAESINRLYQLGHPVALIDGHGSGAALGVIPAARVEGGVLMGALVTDWIVAGRVREGVCGLSIEANRDYSSEAYTAGEVKRYWPTAWAILPAGEQPAVPPGQPLAATESKETPVRLYAASGAQAPDGGNSPDGKGDDGMDEMRERLEALEASQQEQAEKIAALETENGELLARLTAAEQERDQLIQAQEQEKLEAREAVIKDRHDKLLAAETRPGVRDKFTARFTASETLEAKEGVLDIYEEIVDEGNPGQPMLRAAESDTDTAPEDRVIKAAEARSAEKHISFMAALEEVINEAKEG